MCLLTFHTRFQAFVGLYIFRELVITLLLSLICVKREQEQAFQKLWKLSFNYRCLKRDVLKGVV